MPPHLTSGNTHDYGGIEVLKVREVARPRPGTDQVLVAVRAAGINPSEAKIRAGVGTLDIAGLGCEAALRDAA